MALWQIHLSVHCWYSPNTTGKVLAFGKKSLHRKLHLPWSVDALYAIVLYTQLYPREHLLIPFSQIICQGKSDPSFIRFCDKY